MPRVNVSLLTQLDELYDCLLSDEYSEQEIENIYPKGKDKHGEYTVVRATLTDMVRTAIVLTRARHSWSPQGDMKLTVKYKPEGPNTNTFWYKNSE